MGYQDIFKTAILRVSSAVDALRAPDFATKCAEILSGEGIKIDLSVNNDLSEITEKAGLYCFWMNLAEWHKNESFEWGELLSYFSDEWQNPAEEIKFTPKSNKGNIKKFLKDYERSEWVPLYIGKSEYVRKRVEQHIVLEAGKKTYALKLKARADQLKGAKIEVVSLPLEVDKKNYFVVGLVESLVRDKMLPIVGKQ